MKREATISLSIAVVFFFLLFPEFSHALGKTKMRTSPNATTTDSAGHEGIRLAPAKVTLGSNLDARKLQPGQQFRAKLGQTIQLKNGPELPYGTVLIGTVGTDNAQMNGKPTLALRFTRAELKNGKVVPIKATILEVLPQDTGYGVAFYDYSPPALNDQEREILQPNALAGIDLHSNLDSDFSGVFVSTRKDDVKLRAGTEIELSIAVAEGSGQPEKNGPSSLN
jgi:hypothetical protein